MSSTISNSTDGQFSPLQAVKLPHWPASSPNVWVKRDDLIHPVISGNKWRKLKCVDIKAHQHVVSIGGGFSNHLHALGYLCRSNKVRFSAIVRGHYESRLTPMLTDLQTWNSELLFIDKKQYAQRDTEHFFAWVTETFPNALFIPEGGSTNEAVGGIVEIHQELKKQLDKSATFIFAPVASGATLAGLIQGRESPHQNIIGVGVLKGKGYLEEQVERFIGKGLKNWSVMHDFVHGGYGKHSIELLNFIEQFVAYTSIPIEPVYSGKLFFCLDHLIMNKRLPADANIVAIHTGGLQGAR
jgi:1-aminocyclopropane-1-carboxylate deaminase